MASFSLILAEPLDWTAFGIWLSLLLNRHGDDVLRVKGILQVQGSDAPCSSTPSSTSCIRPQHLARWPSADTRSRIVFITRGMDHARLRRSLEAFCKLAGGGADGGVERACVNPLRNRERTVRPSPLTGRWREGEMHANPPPRPSPLPQGERALIVPCLTCEEGDCEEVSCNERFHQRGTPVGFADGDGENRRHAQGRGAR